MHVLDNRVTIVPFDDSHWPGVWKVLEPIFRAGASYPFDPDISEAEAKAAWIDAPRATFVALSDARQVVGTYYIKPNQPGLGAHVCNCGYAVREESRGQGIAGQMCVESQVKAREMGFRAMQYNLVVATNRGAVLLWQRQGFGIVGTLPNAFNHKKFGLVDAHVMYKELI